MLIVIINALLVNLNYICELINGASDSQKKKKKIKGTSNQLVKVVLHLMNPTCLCLINDKTQVLFVIHDKYETNFDLLVLFLKQYAHRQPISQLSSCFFLDLYSSN